MLFSAKLTEQLNGHLVTEYAKIPDTAEVNTRMLAIAVLAVLDPSELSPEPVSYAAYLELKQLARAVCRRRHLESETEAESLSLFDFKLQARYPTPPDDGTESDVYRPIGSMTTRDFDYNIGRLEKEADRKRLHADALRQEREARVRKGMLQELPA